MLKIHEHHGADGALVHVSLAFEGGALVLVDTDGALPLPARALEAVMTRYGAPLEPTARLTEVGRLEVGAGGVLVHVRHLARFDVIARDYLVFEAPGAEPRCALATTVAAALGHLARAARAASSVVSAEGNG